MKLHSGNSTFLLSASTEAVGMILLFSINAQSAFAFIAFSRWFSKRACLCRVDFFAYTPDPKDPLSDSANGTKKLTDLDKTVKAELSAGPQTKTIDSDPVDGDPGHYTATFIPTLQTTYSYILNGTINNTPVNIKSTCVPGVAGDDTPGNNQKVTLSPGVEREGIAGGFPCPLSRSDAEFPTQSNTTGGQ
jgi:hypothetical protein